MTEAPWQIRLGRIAEEDFRDILRYTRDQFGEKQAARYQVTLMDAIAALTEGPYVLGSVSRNDIQPDLRSLHVARLGRRGSHFVLYRSARERTVEVLRILHEAMDPTLHIPPDGMSDEELGS